MALPLAQRSRGSADFATIDVLRRLGACDGDVCVLVVGDRPGEISVATEPLTESGSARILLAPPRLQIGAGAIPFPPHLRPLLAASLEAHLIAAASEPLPDDGPVAARMDRMEQVLSRLAADWQAGRGDIMAATEDLQAWVLAWRGLAAGDAERLDAAWARLAHKAEGSGDDDAGRSTLATCALVGLALGAGPEGVLRLRAALNAARRALSIAQKNGDATLIASHLALAGRTALALGGATSDPEIISEAEHDLAQALALADRAQGRMPSDREGLAEDLRRCQTLRTDRLL